jgi:hypothetical protein
MIASLDLLILTLVDAGIDTPYRWQTQAGLSLGATLPAARRLLARQLVSERKPGPRGRREFRITRTGSNELKNVKQYLDAAVLEHVGDMESILRLFAIALHAGRQDVAARFLQEAASEYERRAGRAQKRASDSSQQEGLAALYLAATSHCEADRLLAQAASLLSLLSQVKKGRGGKWAVRRQRANPNH